MVIDRIWKTDAQQSIFRQLLRASSLPEVVLGERDQEGQALPPERAQEPPSAPFLWLSATVEQRLSGLEIGRFEALGELIVHRRQKSPCFGGPILLLPQSGEARGGTQFPGQGTLPVRPVEGVQEVILGHHGGLRCALQEDKLALDAQQLSQAPTLLVALGSCQRIVHGHQSLGDLPSIGQAFRQCA
jgi:hypothetical protein